MNYAIIKSRDNALLEVIKLSKWNSEEWINFAVVKSYSKNEIVWFEYEYEAIDFLLENFIKEMINPKYYMDESIDGKYYID